MRDGLEEAVAVASAKGVDLGTNYIAQQMELGDKIPEQTKPSMLIDLERGNRLELEWMSGALTRIGQEVEVPTPVHSTLYAPLKLHANGPNGGDWPGRQRDTPVDVKSALPLAQHLRPQWVIHDRSSRVCQSIDVGYAPKATLDADGDGLNVR